MKFVFLFFALVISLLSGEFIYRSKSFISGEAINPDILDVKKKPRRNLLKIEKEIELEPEITQEKKEEIIESSLEEFLNVFYLDRTGKLFIHPKSVLDLRVVTNLPRNSQLYYGFEKEELEIYEFPIRAFEGMESIYYSENKNEPPKEFKVFIDAKAPEIMLVELFGEPYPKSEKKIFAGGTEIEITVADSDSGIKSVRVLNQDGEILSQDQILFEQKKEQTFRFALSHSNIKTLFVEVEDNVSNFTRSEPIEIVIDSNPPLVSLKIEPELSELEQANGLCPRNAAIAVIAEDKETEVSSIEYRYPNKEWRAYKSRLILAKEGDYKIEFRAKDYFGNVSLPVYLECKVIEN